MYMMLPQADQLLHKEFKDIVPVLYIQLLKPLHIPDIYDIGWWRRQLGAPHQHLLLPRHYLFLLTDLPLFGFELLSVLGFLGLQGLFDYDVLAW
jgi:hypothetical protein